MYKYENLAFAGVEIWTVKGGLIIDNMLVTDDVEEAAKERDAVLERAKKEKELYDKIEEEKRQKEEEERKKREEERKKQEEEEERKKQEEEEKNTVEAVETEEEKKEEEAEKEEKKKDVRDEL